MRVSLKPVIASLILLAIGGGVGIAVSRQQPALFEGRASTPEDVVESTPLLINTDDPSLTPATEPQRSNFIADAVERVGPAVVRIDAARTVATRVPDALQNPFFRRFFSEGSDQPSERIERGTGSGFVLSQDGRIITNAHVVEGADVVDVTLKDGRTFEGKVLGVDALTDVAVIQIKADDRLPTAPIGSAETLIPGQWAIAIGNPLGLDNTVTVGIVSAIGRSSAQVGISDKRVQFIQTDAAINPGNSGGPLLNDRGEVIGINTAIRANAQGLGFAIPIETAIRVATQISTSGSAEHPFLGIQMLDLSPEIKAELNANENIPFPVEQETGVFIVQVLPDSPAAAGGLEAGDIIQKIGQTTIKSAADVQAQVENSSIGDPLNIEVLRNTRVISLQVQPGRFPDQSAS